MSLRLRSYDISPPGGYPYVQTEGIRKNFPTVPLIEDQARSVSSFRTNNHLPRASVVESLEDISNFTCTRLGGMAAYCIDSENPGVALSTASPIISPCKGCGAQV